MDESYPAQLFVLQSQDPCALSKQFHFDHREWVGGGEVSLCAPPADKHNIMYSWIGVHMVSVKKPVAEHCLKNGGVVINEDSWLNHME